MRIALAQLNPTVGDVRGNADRIINIIRRAAAERADLVVFSELTLLGYPPKDLLLKPHLVETCRVELARVAAACTGLTALVGFAEPTGRDVGRPLHNALAVCRDGRVTAVHRKTLLPTYDVFDEDRYFEPAGRREVERVHDATGREWRLGLSICEDLWNMRGRPPAGAASRAYIQDPVGEIVAAGAELVINASASPFEAGKNEHRTRLFSARADELGVPVIVVNQVGANDDLIFDGASAVFAPGRGLVARAKAFEEDLLTLEWPSESARVEPYPDELSSIHAGLVLGTRDYVRKCGFQGAVLGLSGGIDSALTAVLAVEAIGADAVHGVALPSRFSSDHSIADARRLAANLGIDFRVLPIETIHRAFEATLAETFAGRAADITEENVQARVRGNLLMALSNKFGWLLLTTGNKSELAVGYCTLYGDMSGGLAVISDVPKTTVYELARRINRLAGREVIPAGSIEKPPSAELRPDQTDQDSLPPYHVLDAVLRLYVEEMRSVGQIVQAGFDEAMVRDVVRKVDASEYKRKQAALGLKVTSRAFGSGRRMPIAARCEP